MSFFGKPIGFIHEGGTFGILFSVLRGRDRGAEPGARLRLHRSRRGARRAEVHGVVRRVRPASSRWCGCTSRSCGCCRSCAASPVRAPASRARSRQTQTDPRRPLSASTPVCRAVTGARLDADHHGIRAGLRVLQLGGELVAVPGHYAIVVIGRGYQRGRIAGAGFTLCSGEYACSALKSSASSARP